MLITRILKLEKKAFSVSVVIFFLIVSICMETKAEQNVSFEEALSSYNYILDYTKPGKGNEKFSKWAYENKGRLNWIMMQNNRDPVKTGAALLELESYCDPFLLSVMDLSKEMSSEEIRALLEELVILNAPEIFTCTVSELLPDESEAVQDAAALVRILRDRINLSEEKTESMAGTDMLFGLCCLDDLAAKRYSESTLTEQEKQELQKTWLWIKSTSYSMMLMLSDPDSDQYRYLENQLEGLHAMEEGEIKMSVSYNDYYKQEQDSSIKLPFIIQNNQMSDDKKVTDGQ